MTVIAVDRRDIIVVAVGAQGPQGIQGIPGSGGGSSDIIKIATIALGGQRVVISDGASNATYASNQVLAHRDFVLGVTTGAASAGAAVTVKRSGEMIEPTWNWSLGNVWLGINGLLTQTPPVSPALFSRIIGTAIAPTVVRIDLREPINVI